MSPRVLLPLLLLAGPGAAADRPAPAVMKLGSLAPAGSPWDVLIRMIAQRIGRETRHAVDVRVYTGGALGDEPDLLRKLRVGQIQAAAVSFQGLLLIDEMPFALEVPLTFESYAELDEVMGKARPRIEAALAKKGYAVVGWSDAGWVQFFTRRPVARVADMRGMKLFVWAGDAKGAKLYAQAGFRPVPIDVPEMLPALQTGLLDAVDCPPLMALVNQWFGVARYMLDLKWAPMVGAVVVARAAWVKIPAGERERIVRGGGDDAAAMRDEIRAVSDTAVTSMRARGLVVTPADAAARAEWKAAVAEVIPGMFSEPATRALYEDVLKWRDARRIRLAQR